MLFYRKELRKLKNNKQLFKDLLSNTIKNNKQIVKEQKETVNEFERLVRELQKQTSEIPVVG